MSWKAPPAMLISRTMPSKVFSTLKLLRKLNDPPPAAIAIAGEISSVLPTAAGSGANALFGAVSGVVVDVTQATSAPVAALVHPVGRAGAVTPSKFSLEQLIWAVVNENAVELAPTPQVFTPLTRQK